MLERFQESHLGEVLGIFLVAGDPEQGPVDAPVVSPYQGLKRVTVARPGPLDEGSVPFSVGVDGLQSDLQPHLWMRDPRQGDSEMMKKAYRRRRASRNPAATPAARNID